MKAIVHIGKPKTGSSSIQQFLHVNSSKLAERGVRYHRTVPRRGSQFEYPMAALMAEGQLLGSKEQRVRYSNRDAAQQRQKFGNTEKALKSFADKFKEPVAVFSTEHATPWLKSKELVQRFDAMFSKVFTDVRYVVYVRREEDLIVSQYSEYVKRGGDKRLDPFIDDRLRGPNQFQIIERWRRVVGKDRLDVRLMDRSFLKGGDLLADFCAVCGIERDGLTGITTVNPALSAVGIEVMRALNMRIPEIHPKGGMNRLRRDLLREVMEMTANAPKLKLNAARAARISEHVGRSNEYMCEAFFPDRDHLYAPYTPIETLDADSINDAALDVFAQLIVKLRLGEIRPLSALARRRTAQRDPVNPTPSPSSGPATTAAPFHTQMTDIKGAN